MWPVLVIIAVASVFFGGAVYSLLQKAPAQITAAFSACTLFLVLTSIFMSMTFLNPVLYEIARGLIPLQRIK